MAEGCWRRKLRDHVSIHTQQERPQTGSEARLSSTPTPVTCFLQQGPATLPHHHRLGTRIQHLSLWRVCLVLETSKENQTSWVLSSMAALYWRVKGQGKKAIDCLRQALHYAPHQMKDVPLISLANILHNAKLWNDAVVVATMAVEIAPHFAVNHFTLGNVYVAMEEFEKALVWYESTLKLQPEFVPAKNRIQTIQCHLMLKKGRRSP